MHCNSKLSRFSRELLVKRYLEGQKIAKIARELGISRKCCYKWIKRYQESGKAGLKERKSGPITHPKRISFKKEERILKARRKHKEGPDRLAIRLNMSSSTVYAVLRRHGKNHLFEKEEKKKARLYEKKRPGDRLCLDLKHLPAIGGKRFKYQVSLLDDCTRYTEAAILERKTTKNITYFVLDFLDRFPFKVKEIMTDNGLEFTMHYTCFKERKTFFQKELAKRGIKHRLIKPRCPEANGKVERFHRTVDEELYRVKYFINEEHRKRELKKYLERYNSKRIHLGIRGMTPKEKLNIFLREKCYQVA